MSKIIEFMLTFSLKAIVCLGRLIGRWQITANREIQAQLIMSRVSMEYNNCC